MLLYIILILYGGILMNIKGLIKKDVVSTINYPEIDGFKVTLRYLGKKELNDIIDECTTKTINPRTRETVERINKEKFANIIAEKVVVSWEGLNAKKLATLIPVDLSEVKDLNEVVEPTFENKQLLLENSSDFDSWITAATRELSNFSEVLKKKEYENLK